MKMQVKIENKKFLRAMRKIGDELDRGIRIGIEQATTKTSAGAKSAAPVNQSGLKTSIRRSIEGLTGKVIVGVKYGPYVEYGTGSKVNVPDELKEYAMQFKGKGIRQVNNRAQPYLYPAFFDQRDKFKRNMDRLLNRLSEKI